MSKYNEVKTFIVKNHRNPSKYFPEEKLIVHHLKRGRELMNAGEMREGEVEKFKELVGMVEGYKIKNQYEYKTRL